MVGGVLNDGNFGSAKQGNIFGDTPFYSPYDAEVAPRNGTNVEPTFPGTLRLDLEPPAFKPVHPDDLPYAQVAHDLGLSPLPVAVSPKPVEDKNQAKVFGFEGTNVRVILDKHRSPWFVGADVCAILGYADAPKAIKQHCKSPELLKNDKTPFLDIPPRGMLIINRPDLFRLILRSQLPAAERFESWVVEEVLPAIQDHGAYLTPQVVKDVLNDPDLIIGLATKLKEEQAQNAKLAAEKARIAEDKAKVEFAKRKVEIEKARVVAVDSHALQMQVEKSRVLGPRRDLWVVSRVNVQA